jgi:hypothetical protein
MHPTSLPRRAEQDRGDGLFEPGVGVGDDQLHPAQTAGFEAAQERGPERAVLGVAHSKSEHFAPTISPDTGSDHHRLGHDSVVDPGLAVSRVQEDIRELLVGQRPVAERAHLLVEVGADSAHFGLGDAGVSAQGADQVVDLPRRDPVQIGLHHHREQRLVDPPPALQQ